MKIAKCPWCANEATVMQHNKFYIACDGNDECQAAGPYADTPDAAIAEWNRVSEAVWGKEAAG